VKEPLLVVSEVVTHPNTGDEFDKAVSVETGEGAKEGRKKYQVA
jgi:hypothetical protein